jgi:hypothetical protein
LGLSVVLVAPLGSGFGADVLRSTLQSEGVLVAGDAGEGSPPTTALLSTPEGVAMATVLGGGEPTADSVVTTAPRAVLISIGRSHLAPPGAHAYLVTGGLELPGLGTLERMKGARALILNEREAGELSGARDPGQAALSLAVEGTTAVLTLGRRGAVAAEGEDLVRSEAPAVDVVDGTGAGDLFAAAYVWADLSGAPLADRLGWATLYAGLSVRRPTALAGALRLPELLQEGIARALRPP